MVRLPRAPSICITDQILDQQIHGRRRPFSSWMKRLTGLKHHSTPGLQGSQNGSKPGRSFKNNPYPESALPPRNLRQGRLSALTSNAGSHDTTSIISYDDAMSARGGRVLSMRSNAPTVATNPGTIHSEGGHSKAGTAHTTGGGISFRDGGANSTFSSPQQSQESLTTTFTTLQSTAPSGMLAPHNALNPASPANGYVVPTTPNQNQTANGPNGALSTQHHVTYHQAIANNILTDNASLLTLASSSKRRRRRSLDTDASVRAIAPSSLFGNSRESLPLSVLSSNIETASSIFPPQNRPTVGLASAERASVYSSSGVAPIITSERNSYYAGKQSAPDAASGASVRSGLLGHGKTDSISGSITGIAQSPLSPREASLHGRSSRRNSDWQENDEDGIDGVEAVEEEEEANPPEEEREPRVQRESSETREPDKKDTILDINHEKK
jgi:hypothetical protein